MGLENIEVAAAALAAILGGEVELADQLLPGLAHRHRVVARFGQQPHAHCVGLRLQRPAIFEQRQYRAELGQLNQVAGIDTGCAARDAGAHRDDRKDVRLAPHVAPLAKLVFPQEMGAFVRHDARQLRLVAHPQQQAREDDREARREHHRIEVRHVRQIDAHVLGGWAPDAFDDLLQIGDDLGILDQQVRPGDLFLHPVHEAPQADLVGVRGLEARPDQGNHVLRKDPRTGDPRRERCSGDPASDEQRAAAHCAAHAHHFFSAAA